MKSIKEFFFGKDDWKVVWSEDGWSGFVRDGFCSYIIKYSPSRNRYKLIVKGDMAEHLSAYQTAIDTLNHFENQL